MSFVALTVVAAVGLGTAVAAGTGKAIAGGVAKKRAREEKERQQAELEKFKQEFAALDTSNPFADMENVFEDLTVNQLQAQFQREQAQQSQANILEQMRGAAGGSGIAALAQTLSRQSQLQAQQASVSIGQQEQQQQMLERQEAAKIQGQERAGELMSREAEASKLQTLMGMKAEDVSAEARAELMAQQAQMSGFSDIAQAGLGAAEGAVSGMAGGMPTG
jgi:hypothetical protein